ncbi:hypothetical protein GCM10023213_38890 [Prosthecobacter algae]|uniref:Peptidase M15C domain-containing protein n=1 Tax=Prosthecobacter algae TaxID=1144682 RepID=A0ABP9PJK7_9BACT
MSETDRARFDRICAMQREIRPYFAPADRAGCVDGFWGPKSQAACQAYLRALMPKENPWPKSDVKSMTAFYGTPGDESNLVSFVFPYPAFYGGKRVTTGRCHWKVKDSLLRILTRIDKIHGDDRGVMEEAEDYGGIFNFRNKRFGTTLSIHAWGAAIDLDADDNSFRDHWPMQADMPLEIMAEFAKEGWISAGAFWGYDAMHFQATR